MKKLFLIISVFVLFTITSCDCEDCGPSASHSYSISNTTEEDIKFSFYRTRSSLRDTLFVIDTLSVHSGKIKHLYSIYVDGIGGQILDARPHFYDSVLLVVDGATKYSFFKADSCQKLKNNPLCEVNYNLIKKEVIKDGTIFTYRIDIVE